MDSVPIIFSIKLFLEDFSKIKTELKKNLI